MRLSRGSRPVWSLTALGLALSLLAAPMAARADDDEDEGQDGDRHRTIRIYSQESPDSRDSRDEARAADGSGYLGVQVQDVTRALQRARNLPTEEGALVNRVEEDSPADRNGIRRGDVIVEVDGQKVGDSGDLIRVVRGLEPGNRVRITLWRSGSLRTVTAQLAERPKSEPPAPPDMGRWPGHDDESTTPMPPMPMPGMRDREQVRREIQDLQAQLQELKAEVRALRAELRRSRDNRDDDDRDRNDD